jgi:high affinity sulfate transporter 1
MASQGATGEGGLLFAGFRGFRPSGLARDLSAGVAVAAVGLPSAIAYPAIAGLPPETGIYASILPLLAYAVFGPSRRLIVGPDAGTMTVLAAAMSAIIAGSAAGTTPVDVAMTLAVLVGGLCLVVRVLGLGVISSFLSRPILTGFFAGISLSILVGQLDRLTGLSLSGDGLLPPVLDLLRRWQEVHLPTLTLSAAMFALLIGTRAIRSPVPGPVVVVAAALVLSATFDFAGKGIAVVGTLPTGLPQLALPNPLAMPMTELMSGALAVFLVSFGAGIISAKSFAARVGEQTDPNRELDGFAAANVAAGLIGAFPVTASDSRTAINISVGGRSQVAGVAAALTLLVALVWFGKALSLLPLSALAVILVGAAISLIDLPALRAMWRLSHIEFAFAMIAMLGPIGFGVLNGVVLAIGATLAHLVWKMMYPKDALLGLIPGQEGFYKLHRAPAARAVPGLGLCLLQGSILFFNADNVCERLREIAAELPEGTRWFVLDASAITQIDITAMTALGELAEELQASGLKFGLAELHAEVRDLLDRGGVLDRIGRDMIFDDLSDTLRAFRAQENGG